MARVTNEDLLAEVITSQETGTITETLGKMMVYIAERYAKRYIFIGYDSSFLEEATQQAIAQMVISYKTFNPKKSSNPLAFFYQSAGCSFANIMAKERIQRQIIKDATDNSEVI